MSILSSIIFVIIAAAAFGSFAVNLKKVWVVINVGAGKEENRFDRLHERVVGMLKGGFLQPKMLKDFWPAVMHYLIFFGFCTVTIGTVETLVHGVFPGFTYKVILGDSPIHKLFLLTQDVANAAVAFAIIWAYYRRLIQ